MLQTVGARPSHIQRPLHLLFVLIAANLPFPVQKAFAALRLDLVMIGVMRTHTVRRGQQTRRRGLHGESNGASVNLNQLPDVAV